MQLPHQNTHIHILTTILYHHVLNSQSPVSTPRQPFQAYVFPYSLHFYIFYISIYSFFNLHYSIYPCIINLHMFCIFIYSYISTYSIFPNILYLHMFCISIYSISHIICLSVSQCLTYSIILNCTITWVVCPQQKVFCIKQVLPMSGLSHCYLMWLQLLMCTFQTPFRDWCLHDYPTPWASCQIRKLRVAHAPRMPGTFSPPPRVSDPDMHHGTCVAHVPWCMPGSLTSSFLWSR